MSFCRHPMFWPVFLAVALHAALMARYVGKFGDVSALVGASDAARGRPPLEAVKVSIGIGGYDGMYYYAIARNPWRVQSIGVDVPAFRHDRILYPAVCWLCSGGDPNLLIWLMPAINLVCIGGMAWLGAWLAMRCGMSPWWGFVLPLAVNACIPALRNLTDVISTLAVFALLAAWLVNGRWWVVAAIALAAVFAREQNLLVVGVLLLVSAWRRQLWETMGFAAVLALWGFWACLLHLMYGVWPVGGGGELFRVPFAGVGYLVNHLGGHFHSTRLTIVNILSLLHLLLLLGISAYVVFLKKVDWAVAIVLLGAVVMAVFAGQPIWDDMCAYRRAFVWIPLCLWLAGMQTQKSWILYALLPAGLFSLAASLCYV